LNLKCEKMVSKFQKFAFNCNLCRYVEGYASAIAGLAARLGPAHPEVAAAMAGGCVQVESS
jgi:hypothetical protein